MYSILGLELSLFIRDVKGGTENLIDESEDHSKMLKHAQRFPNHVFRNAEGQEMVEYFLIHFVVKMAWNHCNKARLTFIVRHPGIPDSVRMFSTAANSQSRHLGNLKPLLPAFYIAQPSVQILTFNIVCHRKRKLSFSL